MRTVAKKDINDASTSFTTADNHKELPLAYPISRRALRDADDYGSVWLSLASTIGCRVL